MFSQTIPTLPQSLDEPFSSSSIGFVNVAGNCANPWVMISNFHVKIDGCVGQSFIRSYAVLTRVTDESDVVLSYVGVTTAV